MADRPLHLRTDAALEDALRGLDDAIDWPAGGPAAPGGPDLATVVRARIEAGETARLVPSHWSWRPARRALVVAVIVLLALAALAGAAGLGLPGLRILFGGPTPSPTSGAGGASSSGPSVSLATRPSPSDRPIASRSPLPGPPGSGLGLGLPLPFDQLDTRAGFHVVLPDDPVAGPPAATWINPTMNDQVTLVWTAGPARPETTEPGIGLLLTEFRGTIEDGIFTKMLGQEATVELVLVDGRRAYWISGDPHQFFYEGPNGFVQDPRRWVGDVLLWANGPITYRLETSLGREAAIDLAESMR